MAKVGYIFMADGYDAIETDKQWMKDFGCCRIVEEKAANEKMRPDWKQLLMTLERGDVLVLSKISNALRGVRELSVFLELCRIKVVRIISIHDKLDSKDEVFPTLPTEAMLNIIGGLPSEVAVLRKNNTHVERLQQVKSKTKATKNRQEREMTIVNMYNGGHSIDDIWHISGFRSRSSVFRILNKHGITLNRGPHSGPIRKKGESKNESNEE
jgi:DNA invertase Pin-like site-specific DNA recombinase